MHSQSVVELKSYTTTYVILDSETHFVYIRTITWNWSQNAPADFFFTEHKAFNFI